MLSGCYISAENEVTHRHRHLCATLGTLSVHRQRHNKRQLKSNVKITQMSMNRETNCAIRIPWNTKQKLQCASYYYCFNMNECHTHSAGQKQTDMQRTVSCFISVWFFKKQK